MAALPVVEQAIPECARCPELRAYCADVASTKRRAYMDDAYWGRPVPGFGDHGARILIIGLAPAAHGANRTGRMFTGDRSGDFLYAALHRSGYANQAHSTDREDGLVLRDVYISAACRCAPPANKPTATQLNACRDWLVQEFHAIRPKVLLCLGGIGHAAAIRFLRGEGYAVGSPQPKFGHGVEWSTSRAGHALTVLGCYHVSQQNTFTGRLTESMIDAVLVRAGVLASGED